MLRKITTSSMNSINDYQILGQIGENRHQNRATFLGEYNEENRLQCDRSIRSWLEKLACRFLKQRFSSAEQALRELPQFKNIKQTTETTDSKFNLDKDDDPLCGFHATNLNIETEFATKPQEVNFGQDFSLPERKDFKNFRGVISKVIYNTPNVN